MYELGRNATENENNYPTGLLVCTFLMSLRHTDQNGNHFRLTFRIK